MHEPWWKSAVVYQIYPASFADSNGDGFGDLAGITQHLDYLASLGVDVVWLSPIYPTPWDDGGYDISDYQNVEPRLGTLDDFDRLLAGVHERGMKLLLDLVPNHTSDEHPWFVESRSSRDNPKRDWYYWRDEPLNWRSEFHQPAWEFDDATGQYYLHLYSRKQPDLNWENPEVRAALYSMMRWWLDRGVDGFRIDVANKISKAMPLVDAPAVPGQEYVNARSQYVNGPRVHEFLQELHREALDPYGARLMTVGETSGVGVENGRLFTDQARRELDMIFTFEHVRLDQREDKFDLVPFDLVLLKQIMSRWQVGLADVGWNSLYWCNHDQPRIVSRWGDDGRYRVESATMLATVLHLLQGTPYIYQGEELGMTNVLFASIEDFQDIDSLNYYALAVAGGAEPSDVLAALRVKSRDNARSPMQWDASPNAGFGAGQPWQRVNPNHDTINAAAAVADPDSVFHYYRRLIELRHSRPVIVLGRYELLLPDDPSVYAFTRTTEDEALLVLANFSADEVTPALPDAEKWRGADVLIGNYPARPDGELTLRPWEARVYTRLR